jgi:membrane-associated protein
MGSVGYPLRRFTFFDTIAALSWATYSALVGLIGGAAFEDDPIKGVVLGIGLAISVTVIVEVVRQLLRRRVTKASFPMKQREREVVGS